MAPLALSVSILSPARGIVGVLATKCPPPAPSWVPGEVNGLSDGDVSLPVISLAGGCSRPGRVSNDLGEERGRARRPYPPGVARESSPSRGAPATSPAPVPTGRVLTVPNLLSLLRLAGVPLFLWLLLGPHADGWALVVLVLGGVTDWLDGKLARLLNQYSTLGALLDPAVDRLYILAALVALAARDVVPWWAVAVLVAGTSCSRPACPCCAAAGTAAVPRHLPGQGGHVPAPVDAFPLLLVGPRTGWFADLLRARSATPSRSGGRRLYLYTGRAVPRPVRARTAAGPAPTAPITPGLGCRRDPRRPALHRGPRVGRAISATAWCGWASPTTRSGSSATSCSSQLPDDRRRRSLPATPVGEVESTKSVSEIYAPVAGEVVAVNEALVDEPELVNRSPTEAAGCSTCVPWSRGSSTGCSTPPPTTG